MTENSFSEVYKKLNDAQRKAVDTIDGPVLVIAGPGTGKTQLLGARVANILQKTDTPARNIVCLTFTENGAANMRERLSRFIGREAYDVAISTYHAFGGDIIRRFPQYFTETNLQEPVDSLGKHQIVAEIVATLPYSNPLKQTQHHLKDLMGTISEVKRALLSADDLRAIAKENVDSITKASNEIADIFDGVVRMPGKVSKSLPYFEKVYATLVKTAPTKPHSERFGSLAGVALQELQLAIEDATDTDSTKSLTAWKNNWLTKTADNTFALAGELENRRILALADVLEQYQQTLEKRGLYDFDDMILRTIVALETHDDLRFSLQEQYLYVLLDEFQDTNAAQLRLVELLTNNPLNEDRPNVMAVGDDDQAIYAFQGAQYSNMLDFYQLYKDVTVISLDENYRSHADILGTASNITSQMSSRLFTSFHGATKQLTAKNSSLPKNASIERIRCISDVSERALVSERIAELIAHGVSPTEIAVLAPKHRILEPLVPYLNALDIPVQYEKRENILEAPLIRELLTMSRLLIALKNGDDATANAYWPEVLSAPSWKLPVSEIWKINWEVNDSRGKTNWTRVLLGSAGKLRAAGLLMAGLAHRTETETLEEILDYLIGSRVLDTDETDMPQVFSPLRDSYFDTTSTLKNAANFYEMLSQLTVLRARVREFQATQSQTLLLSDLLALVDAHKAAEEPILHTSPYHQAVEAVQLMTVYKAKGLEFEHVFLLSCQDEIWGGSGRSNSNHVTIPANLAPIRHSGTTEDERLRLFFVAITRAKVGLHLTSFASNYNGKQTKPLKYLDERATDDGGAVSYALPGAFQTIISNNEDKPALQLLELDWRGKHAEFDRGSDLRDLLRERLSAYQLSPTHLTGFIDLQYAGPKHFFMNTILRFPNAPTIDNQFGNAVHETLEWVQGQVTTNGSVPPLSKAIHYFAERLKTRKLLEPQLQLEIERGELALAAYLTEKGSAFKPEDRAEVNFKHEGVFVGEAHLSGTIDKLVIDPKEKTITVVDYKTGRSHDKWGSDIKLHKYRRQLCCYKILIEGSSRYAGYKVDSGQLDFVEPDGKTNRINTLPLQFTDNEIDETKKLIEAIWRHVQDLNFPDVSGYDTTLTGVKQFEQDLIDGSI